MYRKVLFALTILLAANGSAQSCEDIPIDATTYITAGGSYVGPGTYVVCTNDEVTLIDPDSVWAGFGTEITVVNPMESRIFSNGQVHVVGEAGTFFWAWVVAEENIEVVGESGYALELCPDGLNMYYPPISTPPDACLTTGIKPRDRRTGPVVAPNPVTDRLYILGGDAILGSRLTDLQGREVLHAGAHAKELVVASLAPGQYILSVRTPEGTFARAVVKE